VPLIQGLSTCRVNKIYDNSSYTILLLSFQIRILLQSFRFKYVSLLLRLILKFKLLPEDAICKAIDEKDDYFVREVLVSESRRMPYTGAPILIKIKTPIHERKRSTIDQRRERNKGVHAQSPRHAHPQGPSQPSRLHRHVIEQYSCRYCGHQNAV
jgi:hypothetical protein